VPRAYCVCQGLAVCASSFMAGRVRIPSPTMVPCARQNGAVCNGAMRNGAMRKALPMTSCARYAGQPIEVQQQQRMASVQAASARAGILAAASMRGVHMPVASLWHVWHQRVASARSISVWHQRAWHQHQCVASAQAASASV